MKVTPNHSRRTFTIRFYCEDGSITKYRTIPFSKYEFNNCLKNTENDWNQFLRSTDEYYEIKK